MTHHESYGNEANTESTPFELMIQVLDAHGLDGMAHALQILVNEAMTSFLLPGNGGTERGSRCPTV